MMAVIFFIADEKGFQFQAQPQTGAYSCFGYSLPFLFSLIAVFMFQSPGNGIRVNWICILVLYSRFQKDEGNSLVTT